MEKTPQASDTVSIRPALQVWVGVWLVDAQGNLLLVQCSESGQWLLPGAQVEPGEALEDTARRGVRDTLGLDMGGLTLVRVFSGSSLREETPAGVVYRIWAIFLPDRTKGKIQLNQAVHAGVRFFAPWNIAMEEVEPTHRLLVLEFTRHFARDRSNPSPA